MSGHQPKARAHSVPRCPGTRAARCTTAPTRQPRRRTRTLELQAAVACLDTSHLSGRDRRAGLAPVEMGDCASGRYAHHAVIKAQNAMKGWEHVTNEVSQRHTVCAARTDRWRVSRLAGGGAPVCRQVVGLAGGALLGGPPHQLRLIVGPVPHVRVAVLLTVCREGRELAAPLRVVVRQQPVLPRLQPLRRRLLQLGQGSILRGGTRLCAEHVTIALGDIRQPSAPGRA